MKMPSLSRENSVNRKASAKTGTPPPSKIPPKKVPTNGVQKSPVRTNKDPKLFDLFLENECRICGRQDFQSGSDSLMRHYAFEHFKKRLDAEIASDLLYNTCPICKIKKLKSRFDTRKDLILHNSVTHYRVQYLLAEFYETGDENLVNIVRPRTEERTNN